MASYSVRRVGRSKGLSAGELTGMYCTAAWPVPLSSHWPSSLRQYTLARWRASAPLSPMLAHPALGPGARAAACWTPVSRSASVATARFFALSGATISWTSRFLTLSNRCLVPGVTGRSCN
eukprot:scaffold77840_cov69-Phaeocystis_antarctica.AAC.9